MVAGEVGGGGATASGFLVVVPPLVTAIMKPYALQPSTSERYGERFVCAVRRGNCVATQFHPETLDCASFSSYRVSGENAGYKTYVLIRKAL